MLLFSILLAFSSGLLGPPYNKRDLKLGARGERD
jgi:hypothetical protein